MADQERQYIERLARNRPGPEIIYRGTPMTQEEIRQRRRYIRARIKNSSFNSLPDSELDLCRYYESSGISFFEDRKGRCYALSANVNNEAQSGFRKARAMMPFEYIGIKTGSFDWSLYGEDMSDQKGILNNYLTGFSKMYESGMGLYIYSKTKGSGKTMLSCCILNEITNRMPALSVKFVNALDLLEMTRKGYDGSDDGMPQFYRASVLVIDDIGVQMAKHWVDTVFYRLVNRRYEDRRITIYTSNSPADKLSMDDRIIDRIEARSYHIRLPEVSIRRIKAGEEKDGILKRLTENPGSLRGHTP